MFETLKTQVLQKNQLIKDIRAAEPKDRFRGLPVIDPEKCSNWAELQKICPTGCLLYTSPSPRDA